jgi:hypothetical protein
MRLRFLSAAAFALVALAACGSDSSGPKIGPPAHIALATAPDGSGMVKSAVGSFSVKVTDANGQAVSGAVVNFSVSGGGGVVLTPSATATDASGLASTAITLGTRTGAIFISAKVTGVSEVVQTLITAKPGPLASIISSPETIKLFAVGDTARISSLLQDEFANAVTDFVPTFVAGDPTLVSVDQAGLVRALRAGGTTMVIVSASGRSDSVAVTVLAAGSSPCTGTATATSPAVGAPVTATGANICLTGAAAADAEYTVVAYNTSIDGGTALSATITPNGVATPPSSALVPSASGLLRSRAVVWGGASATPARPVLDESFHLRLLESMRGMGAQYRASRAAYEARLSRPSASGSGFSPSLSRASIPAGASVGDIVQLNVTEEDCSNAILRGFRVAAVGSKSIVLADTLNPANGFSDADYARFAARFDTLVYPLDVGEFGAPTDLDNNGKVAILFTKYVNELTPANSPSFVGGFFHPRDILLRTGTGAAGTCATSNEGEMFYMLVPDPTGAVNGNVRRLGFVDTLTTSVLAHEFQHLINATRRVYITSKTVPFVDMEETWLNEGLSHIAEELLYYRETGFQPRQDLHDADIHASFAKYQFWKADAGSNFSRLLGYIADPGAASPLDPAANVSVETRGAVWAFLRYAVDRLFPSDAGVWARFTNTESLGLATVSEALLTDPKPLLADFVVANYVDDLGISSDPRYSHKSWDFRDIYSKTFGNRDANNVFTPLGYYPITTFGLLDGTPRSAVIRGSSASYYRLAVPAGREALLTFASGQGAPNSLLQFIVVRTK